MDEQNSRQTLNSRYLEETLSIDSIPEIVRQAGQRETLEGKEGKEGARKTGEHRSVNFYQDKLMKSGKVSPHVKVCRTCKSIGHLATNCRTKFPFCRYCLASHGHQLCPSVKSNAAFANRADRSSGKAGFLTLDEKKMMEDYARHLRGWGQSVKGLGKSRTTTRCVQKVILSKKSLKPTVRVS